MLITNLEHNFSVIALSETWTSTQVTNKQLPELRNYQPFYATQGTATKSGYRFYVKKGLKFKSGRDLELAYHDDEGFELLKQNQFAKICECNKEKSPPKKVFGFVNHFMKICEEF